MLKEIRILPICVDGEKLTDVDIYERFPIDRKRFRIVIDRKNPEYLLVVISHALYRKSVMDVFRHFYFIYLYFMSIILKPNIFFLNL